MMSHSKLYGFTLIELLIVMVLIGLASSFVLPNMWQQFDQAKLHSEKKQLTATLEYAKQYSVYKGAHLQVKIGSEFIQVREVLKQTTDTALSDSRVLTASQSSTPESLPLSSHEDNMEPGYKTLKEIQFKLLKLKPKLIEISAKTYFKSVSVSIISQGQYDDEVIEI